MTDNEKKKILESSVAVLTQEEFERLEDVTLGIKKISCFTDQEVTAIANRMTEKGKGK